MPFSEKAVYTPHNERQMIEAIKDGDRHAMKMLYDAYASYAMVICRRYLRDSDTVYDVLQDGFIKIFNGLAHFNYQSNNGLKGWIAQIFVNECLDRLRKNKKISFTDKIPDDIEDDEPSVEIISPETLLNLISRLPDGYRTVLNLYIFEEMSHKEIARELGIKEGTSASQYLRAKKLLATMINKHNQKS